MSDYTMELQPRRTKDQQEDVVLVKRGEHVCGLLTKFRPRKGENHPWKAFLLDGSANRPNTMIGAFYGSGAKGKAFATLVTEVTR
jgi:hypothetical protein